jgi:glycerol uptake facilitator-like aquaporin
MLATKRICGQDFLYFVLAQLAGASMASFAIKYIYGHANGYGLPAIASGTSTGAGVLAEILGTALLVLTIFGVAVDKRSVAASHPGITYRPNNHCNYSFSRANYWCGVKPSTLVRASF